MTDIILTKMAILDYKIDELVSRIKYIDIRLTELYEQREDLYTEYMNLNKPIQCKGCDNND